MNFSKAWGRAEEGIACWGRWVRVCCPCLMWWFSWCQRWSNPAMDRRGITLLWMIKCKLYSSRSSHWLTIGNFFSKGICKASKLHWNLGFFEVQQHFGTVFCVNGFPRWASPAEVPGNTTICFVSPEPHWSRHKKLINVPVVVMY